MYSTSVAFLAFSSFGTLVARPLVAALSHGSDMNKGEGVDGRVRDAFVE